MGARESVLKSTDTQVINRQLISSFAKVHMYGFQSVL